jgi:hypothetical protein
VTIRKKYYPLDEAALMLNCKPADLIHLGVQDKLPVYALADGWYAHVWAREIEDSVSIYGETEQTLGSPMRMSPPNAPQTLNGPMRLQVETLLRYEANADAVTNSFVAPYDATFAPEHINEYRLCNPNNPTQSVEIAIKTCKLVVLDQDLQSINKHSQSALEKPLGETEKKSLLRMVIGMAICGYKYDPSKLKNEATSEIRCDLDSVGISLDDDTIRKYLKEAAQLLPAKEPKKD